MEMLTISAFGLFDSRYDLEKAVESFRSSRFCPASISILFVDTETDQTPVDKSNGLQVARSLWPPLSWLAGAGTITIPGIGQFISSGPLMGLLASVGAGGAVGGLTGAIISAGIPEYDAKRYEDKITSGRILLSVNCSTPESREEALEILGRHGARDISTGDKTLERPERQRQVGNY